MTQQIKKVARTAASEQARKLLSAVHQKLGTVPNILATMAHSASALEAYLAFGDALGKGIFDLKTRELIALTVAGQNGCDYCASAHTAIAKAAGVSADDASLALSGGSEDLRTAAILGFARKVVDQRGFIDGADLEHIREAGLGESEIVELVANVSINIFTNYFNHIAGTEIDFPVVKAGTVSTAA